MILDPGAPVSLVGRSWLSKYLAEFDLKIEDMESSACFQVFWFGGIDKKHESKLLVELPLIVIINKGREYVLKTYVHTIDDDVTFLVGRATIKSWGSILTQGEMFWKWR